GEGHQWPVPQVQGIGDQADGHHGLAGQQAIDDAVPGADQQHGGGQAGDQGGEGRKGQAGIMQNQAGQQDRQGRQGKAGVQGFQAAVRLENGQHRAHQQLEGAGRRAVVAPLGQSAVGGQQAGGDERN